MPLVGVHSPTTTLESADATACPLPLGAPQKLGHSAILFGNLYFRTEGEVFQMQPNPE